MADEHVLVYKKSPPIPFTVSNTTGIAKGALLKMNDPMTAIINSGTNDVVAGVAASEKIASDGKTKLGVYRDGIFKGTASGAITVGDPLGTVATWTNYVRSIVNVDNLSGAVVVGTALETATGGQTFLYELNPTFGAGAS